ARTRQGIRLERRAYTLHLRWERLSTALGPDDRDDVPADVAKPLAHVPSDEAGRTRHGGTAGHARLTPAPFDRDDKSCSACLRALQCCRSSVRCPRAPTTAQPA